MCKGERRGEKGIGSEEKGEEAGGPPPGLWMIKKSRENRDWLYRCKVYIGSDFEDGLQSIHQAKLQDLRNQGREI